LTSGWVYLLGGGAISWASKRQTCIVDSIMAVKFGALAATNKEGEWLRNLLLGQNQCRHSPSIAMANQCYLRPIVMYIMARQGTLDLDMPMFTITKGWSNHC